MPIKWKNPKKFKPKFVLERISKTRSVNTDGSVSFADFQIHQDAAALSSMLEFPPAADDMDKAGMVFSAIFESRPDLSPESFIDAINNRLKKQLSKKEEGFVLIASISFDSSVWQKRVSVLSSSIDFFGMQIPKKFESRKTLIEKNGKLLGIEEIPANYCTVGVSVRAKSVEMAANRALRDLDVYRGILCLEANKSLEISFGGNSHRPINLIRLGSFQTLHHASGKAASEAVWYEPQFRKEKIYRFKKPEIVKKNALYALRRIKTSPLGKVIADSLVRYVSALDESDPNTAFIRLWGAFEMLLTPGVADYDALVERCCFIFQEADYHRQVLLHLREYRNANIHAGHQTDQARTNCFLLQSYYRHLFWFLIEKSLSYRSLSELHDFLSLPQDVNKLKAKSKLLKDGIAFLTP